MDRYRESLLAALRGCPRERRAWLAEAVARIRAAADRAAALAPLSAQAHRRMGDCPIPAGRAALDTPAGPLTLDDWTAADLARAVLILAAVEGAAGGGRAVVEALFRQGDESERAAVCRGLALFDDDARLKHLITEAGRANSLRLLSAVSQRNPYPQAHYTDHEFNQLVLKALFVGLPIARIAGLEERANAELARMCEDYVAERRAAGREIPCDIWLAIAPHASAHAERLMCEYLRHDNPEHRCYSGSALGRRSQRQPRLRALLEERLQIETNARVRAALQTALAGRAPEEPEP